MPTLKEREAQVEKQIHKRKSNRNRKHRLHQGVLALREAKAVKALRKILLRIRGLRDLPRIQYDSVSVANIPHDAEAAAYYVNGMFANESAVKRQAPNARYTSIAVNTSAIADSLDIEPGNATVADAAQWYRAFKHARPHDKPIFYCSASDANSLVGALRAAGITRDRYLLWTAHYIGKHFCGEGCDFATDAGKVDATQFTTNDETLDESVCRVTFWQRNA